jgi:recombinase-like zinc beta ribbon protein
VGQVRFQGEIYAGAQLATVDCDLWQRVQAQLEQNRSDERTVVRSPFRVLLQGLLRCGPCGCAMTASHSTRNGHKRYRYYVCSSAQKRGRHTCPSPSVPAGELERFVMDQLRSLGSDPSDPPELAQAMAGFEPAWAALIERIDYDGRAGTISISLNSAGLAAITSQLAVGGRV